MVSAIVLYNRKSWSYDKFFEDIDFNLMTCKALGLWELGNTAFSQSALFDSKQTLHQYQSQTGINLEKELEELLNVY